MVCHGIPDSTVLVEGDVVDGVGIHGDTDATSTVGRVDQESARLVGVARERLEKGIAAVRPGRTLGVVGRVVEEHAARAGTGSVRGLTGHGISTAFHSGVVVPHLDSSPEHDDVVEPGMTSTAEPMTTLGARTCTTWDDGWTVVTSDRRRTARFEHTLVVTETGAEVLTLP